MALIEVPNSSVLDKLLESRLTLSTSETRMVHDSISSTQSSISEIDDKLNRLKACIDKLQHNRDILVKFTMKYSTLLVPSRCLPHEILSEIFLHCLEPKQFDPPHIYHVARLDKVPLLVGQVCSRWRDVALSTPRLWESFALTIRPKYLKNDVLLAKTWLGRSGTRPLSINIASVGNFHNPMRPLMQVLLSHSERWYNVQFSLPLSAMGCLSAAKNRLPMLRRLFIGREWNETMDVFEHVPQLQCFHLGYDIAPSLVKIPWNQLQYCDTGTCSTDCCLDILRSTPNLKGCRVSPYGLGSRDSQPTVELSHLRSMTLYNNPMYLLDRLVTPELREVSVHLTHAWKATQQLISLLLRSSVRVLSFYSGIRHHRIEDDLMTRLLQASHTLVELELREYTSLYLSQSFLTQFAHGCGQENPKAPHLAPNLQTIRVDYTPSIFNIAEFVAAIKSRMIFRTLKRVEIHFIDDKSHPDSTVMLHLRELRDSTGLNINVLHCGRELIQTGGQ